MLTKTVQSIRNDAEKYLMNNYGVRDLALVRGEGVHVWDADGTRYVDLLSGLGVNNLGHCPPKVVAALQRQAETLLHVSNLYLNEPQTELGRLLVEHSSADRAFFCNSGTEANEAAIKLARRYARAHGGENRFQIVALHHSFHGRTMGSLSATGQVKYHEGFAPMLEGFVHTPINDLAALRKVCDEKTCAVLIEPVQGEGGIHPCTVEFLRGARELCDERGMLLIFDEVQCGLGRCGRLFASEECGIEPDLVTLAKSLAGGAPIGALLAKEKAAEVMGPGSHAATFGGNPLCCAAGVAAFSMLLEEHLPERSRRVGEMFLQQLRERQSRHKCMVEVRGKGLMIGVEFTFPVADLIKQLRDRGYIAGSAGPQVLRFLPPLIIEEEILNQVVLVLEEILVEMESR